MGRPEPEYTDGLQTKHVQSLRPVEVEILSWEVSFGTLKR
jgi:hypothetical protein